MKITLVESHLGKDGQVQFYDFNAGKRLVRVFMGFQTGEGLRKTSESGICFVFFRADLNGGEDGILLFPDGTNTPGTGKVKNARAIVDAIKTQHPEVIQSLLDRIAAKNQAEKEWNERVDRIEAQIRADFPALKKKWQEEYYAREAEKEAQRGS